MNDLSMYTSTRVHRPFADKLDLVQAAQKLHADRFSITDSRGIWQQVLAHANLHRGDPDVEAYLRIPQDAFESRAVGDRHGVIPVSLADIHHSLHDTRPVAYLVLIGHTLFLRAEISAVKRAIRRPDGEDEPAFGFLVLGMISHLHNLIETRWFVDATRAGRDAVDWARILRRHKELGIYMRVGTKQYDLRQSSDRIMASVLATMTGEDDPERRKKLVQGRLLQFLNGGAALSVNQMPYGFTLARTSSGAFAHDGARRRIPEPVLAEAEALRVLHTMHAEGATQQDLAREMARLEADGQLMRRAGQRYRRTFADADDPQRRYDATKSFFRAQQSPHLPSVTPADLDAVTEYLEGGDPTQIFTPPQRLLINRIELLRTGRLCRGLASDIRERGLELVGQTAIPRDELDEYGYFVVDCPWPVPVDEHGVEVPRFGIDDAVLRASAARVLTSLRPQRPAKTGGAAHRDGAARRVLQGFAAWEDPQRGTQGQLVARQNNSNGGANIVLFERPIDSSQGLDTGWSKQTNNPRTYARATVRLNQLCDSVADSILDAMTSRVLPPEASERMVLVRLRDADRPHEQAASLRHRAEAKAKQAQDADTAASGARRLAALAIEMDDPEGAATLMGDAKEHKRNADLLKSQCDDLRAQADEVEAGAAAAAREESADLRTSAYLVAGLRRAARNNGSGPRQLGLLADELLKDWMFTPPTDPVDASVSFTVTLRLPLADGGTAVLPLIGRVADVRKPPGEKRQTDYRSPRRGEPARLVLGRGMSIDEAADRLDRDRERIIIGSVAPWLIEHGVSSRGARGALIDHPFGFVRQILYRQLLEQGLGDLGGYGQQFCDHLHTVYTNAMTHWGDAACPDDTTHVSNTVATVAAAAPRSLSVSDVVRLTGLRESAVRGWVMPQQPTAGFRRPIYLGYAADKQRLRVIDCPHADCEGGADTVALLPEVAASGYGVLCSSCRRAPSTQGDWSRVVFPIEYLRPLTRTPEIKLRNGARTKFAAAPVPFMGVAIV